MESEELESKAPRPDSAAPETAEPEPPGQNPAGPETTRLDATEPDTTEPDTPSPKTAEPTTTAPETPDHTAAEPKTKRPDTAEPVTPKPDTTEPDTPSPKIAEPTTTAPETAGQTAAEPKTARLDATKPVAVGSKTARPPGAAEPDVAKPGAAESQALIAVRDLRIAFGGVEAVRGVSFDVRAREVLAIVGESGAGKSLTARALLGMLPRGAVTTGSVRPDLSAARGRRIALVPQDALSALSPVHPVGDQLAAAVRSVARVSRAEARSRAVAALDRVGIPDAARKARAFPHEFSGGMRQRAVIAMATVNDPDILVADEPTTALDEERRDQVLRVLAERREAVGAALVLVTHDLDVVREHADRALVMYAGRLTELGPAERVLERPLAPYTAGLLASLPRNAQGRRLPTFPGTPPTPGALPSGCAFAPRCHLATETCHAEEPEPRQTDGRLVSCHHWERV